MILMHCMCIACTGECFKLFVVPHSVQATTVKQWLPLLTFATFYGAEGVEAVDNFEAKQKHQVGMHTFAKLAAVADPRFLQEALEVMKGPKPTVAALVTAIARGAKKQWYTWHVMSSGTPVHAERSVFMHASSHGT